MQTVGIGWKEEDQYDNFDNIANTLFAEFVLHPLTNDVFGYDKSFRYDFSPFEADWGTLVVNDAKSAEKLGTFVRLSHGRHPFDIAIYMANGAMGSIAVSKASFLLACEVP